MATMKTGWNSVCSLTVRWKILSIYLGIDSYEHLHSPSVLFLLTGSSYLISMLV